MKVKSEEEEREKEKEEKGRLVKTPAGTWNT